MIEGHLSNAVVLDLTRFQVEEHQERRKFTPGQIEYPLFQHILLDSYNILSYHQPLAPPLPDSLRKTNASSFFLSIGHIVACTHLSSRSILVSGAPSPNMSLLCPVVAKQTSIKDD